jgi:hypothetical protein
MKTLPALLCAAALFLCVSGCGDESEPDTVSTSSSPKAAASVEPVGALTPAEPSAAPAPVNATVDAYISKVSAALLASPEVAAPGDFQTLLEQVDTPSLKGVTAWMENNGLFQYIGSGGDGGIYFQEDTDGRSIGIYAGGYQDGLRSGDCCAWVTMHDDDNKLYTGSWSGDYPDREFKSYTLTTNSGNLIAFSGLCRQGVWDGPVNVSYVAPDSNPLKGIFACDMGVAAVSLRPDGQFWNSDTDKRFCFLALSGGGGRHIPLYRNWSDQYFVTRMAYNATLIGQ